MFIKPYYPSRPLHVLHVIGLIGVGKSHFFQEYFPTLPVFNFGDIYQKYQYSLKDMQNNFTIYQQYKNELKATWEEFLRNHDPRDNLQMKFCIGVESSGIDHILNTILVPFFPTVLLIHGDPPPLSFKAFWKIRPYGPALNAILREKIAANLIPFTHIYDKISNTFSSPLPREFSAFSPHFGTLNSPRSTFAQTCLSTHVKTCPKCGAPFFTKELFTIHLQHHIIILE